LALTCDTGFLSIDALSDKTGELVFDVGIIPVSTNVNTYCSNSAFDDPISCSDLIDRAALKVTLEEICVGKNSCYIEDFSPFVDISRINEPSIRQECFNDMDSFVFI